MPLAEAVRRQYLDAMGITLWEPRDSSPAARAEEIAPRVEAPAAPLPVAPGWDLLETEVRACTKCGLHKTRTQTVFGVGNRRAQWMFVGEAPGADEDAQGEPFVGRAGQLLNAMIAALGLKRDEVEQCEPYLVRQIELIQPKLIVALGRHAVHSLLKTDLALARLRGQRHNYHDIPLIVTYHPAYLLRTPSDKRKAWEDLLRARRLMQELQA
jgi:uracil-DNA glycosylase